jgi:hypothetical protein
MRFSPRLRFVIALALSASVGELRAEGDAGSDGLRWTPHRRSLAGGSADEQLSSRDPTTTVNATRPAAATAAAPNPARAPSAAAASVALPAGVPAVDLRPPRAPVAARRPDQRRAPAAAGFGESFRRAIDPSNPEGIFGTGFNRVPQGEVGRPLLGDERPQAAQRRVTPATGIAPAPRGAAPTGRQVPPQARATRPQRLALNADGMPSVLSQPTPAAAAPAAQPLPAPRVTAESGPTTITQSPTPALPDTFPGSPGEIILEDPSAGIPYADDGGMAPEFSDGAYFDDGSGGPMFPDGAILDDGTMIDDGSGMIGPGWTGETFLHVPSPYDDPFACEDGEPCGCLPFYEHDGRICTFLRRFGRPYYGWRWYRDFSASAGVTSFQNPIDLGLLGNYGFNEYVNWGMPFWNALGIGWQVGARGVQSDFQSTTVRLGNQPLSNGAGNQVFVTTGFYTRAFEGRGFQGGAVWDYLRDDLHDDVDLSQVRGEVSYVWGFHEFGFWGAANTMGRKNVGPIGLVDTDTIDIYAGFYRLLFGDANELKAWGGGTGQGDFILGSLVRAPMNRSLALEGTFTYLIPQASKTIPLNSTTLQGFSGQAWNVAVNLVWYPACRARRGLSSPYRPLFEVADNGSMIRTLAPVR